MIRMNKSLHKNNSGSTMIETLVSFVILVLVLAALSKMVSFSSELRMRAVDTANVRNSFNQEIYKAETDDAGNPISGAMTDVKTVPYYGILDPEPTAANEDTAAFVLVLDVKTPGSNDKNKTDVEKNFGTLSGNQGDLIKKQITFPYLDATSYVSTDSRIKSEELATPKVLKFHYNPNEKAPDTNP